MIDKLRYDEISAIANDLHQQAEIIENLIKNRNINELTDFAATIEGYCKFLNNTVELYKDADKALEELKNSI